MLFDDAQSEKVIEAAGAGFPKTFILGAQGVAASAFIVVFQNSITFGFRAVRFELRRVRGGLRLPRARASSAVPRKKCCDDATVSEGLSPG